MSVDPIPEGFHSLTPHLSVGDASAAIDFYKRAFDAVEHSRAAGPGGRLMNAQLRIGDSMIMLADEFPEFGPDAMRSPQSIGGTPVCIHLYVRDADASFKQAVAAGATVKMPLADQFWGDRYGVLVDPFGHLWSIATRVRDMSSEEHAKAAEAFNSSLKG